MHPYFIWDYDVDEKQIRTILSGSNEAEKLWLIGRILSHAHYKDVWQYLNIKEISAYLPKLRIPAEVKANWQRALEVWGYR